MRTLFKLLLIGLFLSSCSSETRTERGGTVTDLNVPQEFWGDWHGRDYHRTLHIEEHSITMELSGDDLVITTAVQMVYDPYVADYLGISEGRFLAFEMFDLNGMLVTLTADQQELYRDFYERP